MRSFKKYLDEGNPLARNVKFETGKKKRHLVTISAERKGKSDKENSGRTKDLKQRVKAKGFGFRPAKGMYDGGEEDSVVVYAKGTGMLARWNLLRKMKKLGKRYDQDNIMRHDGKTGTLIGTNKEFGVNKKVPLGKQRYNVSNPEGETAYKPRKPESQRPKFTMKNPKNPEKKDDKTS